MKISAFDIRIGNLIEHQGKLWRVAKKDHVKPGKGGAFVQLELKQNQHTFAPHVEMISLNGMANVLPVKNGGHSPNSKYLQRKMAVTINLGKPNRLKKF